MKSYYCDTECDRSRSPLILLAKVHAVSTAYDMRTQKRLDKQVDFSDLCKDDLNQPAG